ncbi:MULTISPECIES: DUF433 domain-containing protein [unclassified Anabaena]|uniref:DUF433 domain-containing protein n=1 Tax=unclassified Anabaena TaxID=2619674 RepID=UPI00082A7834|nr:MULTISPECIES: DUF433 domain-containing protein [unclassified Anabaena]
MVTITDIGTLITRYPNLHGGRLIIAGTGSSVRRIAALYKQGYSAEEIAADKPHLTLTQIYAALTYYHANKEEIDQDLAEEQAEYERLSALHYSQKQSQQ